MTSEEKRVTLASLDEMPHLRPIDLSKTAAEDFAINCKVFKNYAPMVSPDSEALCFYACNHLVAVLKSKFTRNEPLPLWAGEIVTMYKEQLAKQGNRLIHYMTLIATRESRHTKEKGDLLAEVANKFGSYCVDFHHTIKGKSSSGAVDKFLSNPPKGELGNYLRSLTYLFFNGGFNGGYGGKPWGMIAQTLEQCVTGKTSLEVMIDTAYTLAHNNGPMFNKGMMYQMYTQEIYKILDVQRSGQIPEFIMFESPDASVPLPLRKALEKCHEEFPSAFGGYVDWQKVEDLGSLHKYGSEKKAQLAKQPAKPELTLEGYEVTGKFQVLPNKSAKIYLRTKAA